jgi:hypothetical protein
MSLKNTPKNEQTYESTRQGVPEIALWRAVVLAHITDAIFGRGRDKEQAINWIFGGSAGFRNVCEMAMLEPTIVRSRVLQMQIEPPKELQTVVARQHHTKKLRRGQVR